MPNRNRCWCFDQRKPCSYHEGELDGQDNEHIRNLRKAIEDAGPYPESHWRIMRRHRAEWPALWRAIDALLAQD